MQAIYLYLWLKFEWLLLYMLKKLHFYLIFLLILPFCLKGQQYNATQLSLESGLSQSSVSAIVQDEKGFLWLGTQDGLNRYDGYEFRVIKHIPFDSTSLSSNYITALCTEKEDKVWVGTPLQGLNLYNPRNNSAIHFHKKSQYPLSDNRINDILKDKFGQIWVATSKGINRIIIDNKAGKTSYRITQWLTNPLPNRPNSHIVNTLYEDDKGRIWLGTSSGMFFFQNESAKAPIPTIKIEMADTMRLIVNAIRQDNHDKIWVGTNKGLFKYDEERKLNVPFGTDIFQTPTPNIRKLYKDSRNTLWISTEESRLYGLKLEGMPYERVLIDKEPFTQLNQYRVDAIFEDRIHAGIIWAGCFSGGLYKIVPASQRFFSNNLTKYTNNTKSVMAIGADEEDLWIGTSNGLFRLDRNEEKGEEIVLDPSNPRAKRVQSVYQDFDHNVWVATAGGIFRLKKQGLHHFSVQMLKTAENCKDRVYRKVYEDTEHYIYFITNRGLNIFDPHSQAILPCSIPIDSNFVNNNNRITNIHRDAKNRFWIATFDGLMLIRNFRDPINDLMHPKPEIFRHNTQDTLGLRGNTIVSIYEDSKGYIWLGTTEGLLEVRDNGKKITFVGYAEKAGLMNSTIYGILEDSIKKSLWMSTNGGLYRFSLISHKFENFDVRDGIQSNEFNEGGYFKAKNGEMFFGGINGFTRFFPYQIRSDSVLPRVWITHFTDKNGERHELLYENEKRIETDYGDNSFIISFIGILFSHPEDVHYSYTLTEKGQNQQDVKPISLGSAHQVPFSNLPPGTYIFRVIGTNADGLKNTVGDVVEIVINPPFWRTVWFYLIVLLAIGSGLWLLHQYRVQQKVQRVMDMERVRKNAAADFHDELGHKLTVISLFTNIVKQSLGEESKLSPHLTKVIDTSNSLYLSMKDLLWVLDPNKDSLHDMALMLKDFGDQLFDKSGVAFRTDGITDNMKGYNLGMDHKRHIALIFKEVMNNAMKHAKCQNTDLHFEWNEAERHVAILFHDDGKGFDPKNTGSSGNGLINLQDRANQVGGRIEFISGEEGKKGSTVKFEVTFAHLLPQKQNFVERVFDKLEKWFTWERK